MAPRDVSADFLRFAVPAEETDVKVLAVVGQERSCLLAGGFAFARIVLNEISYHGSALASVAADNFFQGQRPVNPRKRRERRRRRIVRRAANRQQKCAQACGHEQASGYTPDLRLLSA